MTFQFPIADARPFSSQPELRLSLPDWPELGTTFNPQFVHHFGKACERVREPDEAWPDENKYVLARRGLRFDRLETHHAGLPKRRFRPQCAFRRLFSDGGSVVRAEIGIAHPHSVDPLNDLALGEVLGIVRNIAVIPTLVQNLNGETKLRPLLAQGKYLARLYAQASMNRAIIEPSMGSRLVESADPLILVELQPCEANLAVETAVDDGLVVVDYACVNGAMALSCRLNTPVGIVSTWMLQQGAATIGQLRSLRLCLIRLHAERAVLDLILKQIDRGWLLNPSSEAALNLLDRYFNERLKIINRDTWGGMKQSVIVSAFDMTQAMVRPASQSLLIARYQGGRRQVQEKIRIYQEQRLAASQVSVINAENGVVNMTNNTGNIYNNAESMSNVTNTVNNNIAECAANAEVKALIQQLNEEIARIAAKIDSVQLKKMEKGLEALSNVPERPWYKVSLDGITEAAQAVGEIATPIISIVGKLSALLLA